MNTETQGCWSSGIFGVVVRYLTAAVLLCSIARCGRAGGAPSPREVNDAASSALGASCSSNKDCGADGFCARPDGACSARFGTCANAFLNINCIAGPSVCGCDGKTYPGDCARTQAGVSKRHDGACP